MHSAMFDALSVVHMSVMPFFVDLRVCARPPSGQQIYIVNNSTTLADCTELANIPLGGYQFLTNDIKCTGPGEGYFLNGPANISGAAPPIVGGEWACNYFRSAPGVVSGLFGRASA